MKEENKSFWKKKKMEKVWGKPLSIYVVCYFTCKNSHTSILLLCQLRIYFCLAYWSFYLVVSILLHLRHACLFVCLSITSTSWIWGYFWCRADVLILGVWYQKTALVGVEPPWIICLPTLSPQFLQPASQE